MSYPKLTLEEKFGQMLLIGLDLYEINDEILRLIKDYKIGGVVLYKKNYTSINSMIEVVNKLKEINKDNKVPLFIGIDQENGRVNRLPKDIRKMPSAKTVANSNDLRIAGAVNELTTFILSNAGVNMNFAPVLDIVRSDKNKVIGNRSYGDTKEKVIEYAIPFMKEMQKRKIVPVVKHFPGHGLVNGDSHLILPKIHDVKTLSEEDLCVFDAAIKNGADAIMVGHLIVKGYGITPSSLNKDVINDLLLKGNNYNGLIVTDDLRMKSLRILYPVKKSIKKAISAGNNVIIVKYKKNDTKLYDKLIKSLKKCEIDPELVNNSCKKILAIKSKYGINDNLISGEALKIDMINDKIDKIFSILEK